MGRTSLDDSIREECAVTCARPSEDNVINPRTPRPTFLKSPPPSKSPMPTFFKPIPSINQQSLTRPFYPDLLSTWQKESIRTRMVCFLNPHIPALTLCC